MASEVWNEQPLQHLGRVQPYEDRPGFVYQGQSSAYSNMLLPLYDMEEIIPRLCLDYLLEYVHT